MKNKDLTITELLTLRSQQLPNGCRVWTGKKNQLGYGQVKYLGVIQSVHRLAYEDYYDDYLGSYIVRHMCDNPSCINPLHLVKGTQLENMRDKFRNKVLTPEGGYEIIQPSRGTRRTTIPIDTESNS